MSIDETPVFEEFVHARQQAVELTDRYRATPADALDHDQLWEQVMRQTEQARALLETWLEQQPSQGKPNRSALREHEPAIA